MPQGPHYTFDSSGATAEILSRDEAEGLLARATDEPDRNRAVSSPALRVEAVAGRFRFAHAESDVRQGRGEILRPTHSAKIIPYGKPMFAGVDRMPDEGQAELVVREADFDFLTDAVGSVFSGSDRADSPDVPVATEQSDEHHTQIDFGVDTTTDGAYEEYTFTLRPPGRASEVTLHIDTLPAFPTGTEIHTYIRFGHGHEQNDPVTVTGSTPNGAYNNPDYLIDVTGSDDLTFVTADVPSYETLQVVVTSDASGSGAEANLNAMVR